jgi:hypothetical protein
MGLYIHYPISFHGVVLNLSTGTTSPLLRFRTNLPLIDFNIRTSHSVEILAFMTVH